ncbi:hypothetical protein [Prevotella dentasini]|nr:hypothetical protein [Prevotella dentasini]
MEQDRSTMLGTGNTLVSRCYNSCSMLHVASSILLLVNGFLIGW